MDIEIIKGDDFYKKGMEYLFKQNNLEYKEGRWFNHIKYGEDINTNYQYKIIREITHDGTLYFTYQKMIEIFFELLNRTTIYKPYLRYKENIKDIKYTIGDMILRKEYDVKTKKKFPMMTVTFELPIYCEINLED